MPTAPRLLAALCLAAAGALLAHLYLDNLTREFRPVWAMPGWALIGLLVGWRVVGARPGADLAQTVNQALAGAALTLFWGVLFVAVVQMVLRSTQKRYQDLESALLGVFDLMAEGALVLLTPEALGAALLGGLLAASLSAWSERRWK
jgi:hypothetical protein